MRGALRSAGATAALALSLAACSDGPAAEPGAPAPSPAGSPTGSPTESPTADVSVPAGVALTAQGTDLSFGDTATVVFEPDQNRGSVLELTVRSVRQGTLADFAGFVLDDEYKREANYYYVRVTVTNVGTGDVGGAAVPLWGVNAENTLLPAVAFRSEFGPCASTPLPEEFGPGDSVDTCLVYLSPDAGTLEAVSFRPDQAFGPIEWTGEVKPPKEPNKKR